MAAPHGRHDHIQNDQIDHILFPTVALNRFPAAAGCFDTIAEFFEQFLPDLKDHLFIVHQQNGFLAGADIVRNGLCLRRVFFGGGKIDIEGRAAPFFTVNSYLAGVVAQNAENRGQAQTGAAAHFAGCEKRLKNTVAGGGIHAAARVRHGHFHIIARRQVRWTDIIR